MITRQSPAKVNLCLRVLNKRPDGYHNIASLMTRISLADEMEFRAGGKGIKLSCPGSGLPEDSGNLVFRAAQALLTEAGVEAGVEITLRKNIPSGAGLGGGSSNAATALMAINELLGLGFGTAGLMGIGKRLGADVPFFIFGRAAWAFGIGEVLEPAAGLPDMHLVLANPGFEVSTREVYEGLGFSSDSGEKSEIFGLTKGASPFNIPVFNRSGGIEQIAGMLHNDLESVTLKLHPQIADIKDSLIRCGAAGCLMSGSGPTVFGLFQDEESASRAAAGLQRESCWSIFKTRSLE